MVKVVVVEIIVVVTILDIDVLELLFPRLRVVRGIQVHSDKTGLVNFKMNLE